MIAECKYYVLELLLGQGTTVKSFFTELVESPIFLFNTLYGVSGR